MARELKGLSLVEKKDRVEPADKVFLGLDLVGVGGALEQLDLSNDFELLLTLVKVDQTVRTVCC